MRKLIVFVFILAIGTLNACSKGYTCHCTNPDESFVNTSKTGIFWTQKAARKACKERESVELEITCTFK